jgi:HEAT repeat protein
LRIRLHAGAIAFAVAVVVGGSVVVADAQQQVSPYQAQKRYNDSRSGRSIDEWTQRLEDPDPTVRIEAVKSLADSNKPEAIEYIIQATGDPDEGVSCKAIDSLGRLRATAATNILVQKLFLRDIPLAQKKRILVALGRMGDVKACQPIMEFMRQDTEPDVVGTAIFALGEIGDQSALPQLEAIQKDGKDEHLSRLASEAIAKIDAKLSPATVAVTVPALEDDRLRGQVETR